MKKHFLTALLCITITNIVNAATCTKTCDKTLVSGNIETSWEVRWETNGGKCSDRGPETKVTQITWQTDIKTGKIMELGRQTMESLHANC